MQVGMFKKTKIGWIQQLFISLSNSTILCKNIENTISFWDKHFFQLEVKNQQKIIHPPDIAFRLEGKMINKLRQKLERTRKNIHGMLIAESIDSPINNFIELNTLEEDDVGAVQQLEGVFCVGISMSKGDGQQEIQRRVKQELRRCSERSGAIYSHNSKTSELPEISKTMIRQIRVFIIIDETRGAMTLGKLIFFPNVNIPLKKIKINKLSMTENSVYADLRKLNYNKDLVDGLISINFSQGKYRFILLDKNDPQLHQNMPSILGVWIAGNLSNHLQRDAAFWSVIMEYLTNPQITKKISLVGDRSGLLFVFQQDPKKISQYIFEIPKNSKWNINYQTQNITKIPQEYTFSHQQVIHQEQKQESQVESIHSRQERQKNNNDLRQSQVQQRSSKSCDEKDVQINRLKTELQFYKNKCQKLQEIINNIALMQVSKGYNHGFSALVPPHFQPQNQYSTIEPPYFGKKSFSSSEPQSQFQGQMHSNGSTLSGKFKQYTVKDNKNISFAQQNSLEDSFNNKDDDIRFISPQFRQYKQVNNVPKRVISNFNQQTLEYKENNNQISALSPISKDTVSQNKSKQTIEPKNKNISYQSQQQQKYTKLAPNIQNLSEKYGSSYPSSRNKTPPNYKKEVQSPKQQRNERKDSKSPINSNKFEDKGKSNLEYQRQVRLKGIIFKENEALTLNKQKQQEDYSKPKYEGTLIRKSQKSPPSSIKQIKQVIKSNKKRDDDSESDEEYVKNAKERLLLKKAKN